MDLWIQFTDKSPELRAEQSQSLDPGELAFDQALADI
jgi:hypothetical protein